jgi:hypothetical protein
VVVQTPKDPDKVQAGREGARRRWGRQRTLRLDELPESIRLAVEALVAAEQAAKAREAASDAG